MEYTKVNMIVIIVTGHRVSVIKISVWFWSWVDTIWHPVWVSWLRWPARGKAYPSI